MIFKERKQTLVDLMKMLLTNVVKVCLETVQPDCDVYETAFFMIDDIFIQNSKNITQLLKEKVLEFSELGMSAKSKFQAFQVLFLRALNLKLKHRPSQISFNNLKKEKIMRILKKLRLKKIKKNQYKHKIEIIL